MTVPGDTGGWNRDKLQAALRGGYRTVIGVFPSVDDARAGLERLHRAGFDRDMLSLVTRGTDAAAEIPSQAASEQASGSSLAGALGGGVVGGVLGGLVGAGLLAIPGAGPLLAAGWLASALGGAAVGAGAGGWIASVAGRGEAGICRCAVAIFSSRMKYTLTCRSAAGDGDASGDGDTGLAAGSGVVSGVTAGDSVAPGVLTPGASPAGAVGSVVDGAGAISGPPHAARTSTNTMSRTSTRRPRGIHAVAENRAGTILAPLTARHERSRAHPLNARRVWSHTWRLDASAADPGDGRRSARRLWLLEQGRREVALGQVREEGHDVQPGALRPLGDPHRRRGSGPA